jgi:propionyl-CoA synthetase
MGGYRDLFNASIADPAAFWADAARAVTWTREPQRVLDESIRRSIAGFPMAS